MKILNPAIIGNWENWLRVFLMVAIGAAVLHFSGQLFNKRKVQK